MKRKTFMKQLSNLKIHIFTHWGIFIERMFTHQPYSCIFAVSFSAVPKTKA